MNDELAEGQLSGTAFDRYCMVLFAGIAAEALVYGISSTVMLFNVILAAVKALESGSSLSVIKSIEEAMSSKV
ncbi:hypothetical protein Patl1_20820 [Pistacia atlantica]|uniref:Uncharacterized protein n=1 Tax=Pistacia atlantica TaxID=434234 RepID=A0ACC1BKT4_9ROSI|nr:hypothetical protein Patl1_20820 [Pistacia atlantica]